jgi:alpha-L-fucosidase 2
MKSIVFFSCLTGLFLSVSSLKAQPNPAHDLQFKQLPARWDEGIPLGNGWLGALIWQKENKLRLSLDRVDLWDDRPMPEIDQLKFSWVVEKVIRNQYDSVQKIGDEPYEKYPAPTKIPGAAIEFDLARLGKLSSGRLHINNGLSTMLFENGVVFNCYIHASRQTGYFGFESCTEDMIPKLKIPGYNSGKAGGNGSSVEGQGLERLGYANGTVTKRNNSILYHQPTYQGHYYEVLVQWFRPAKDRIIGQWTISNDKPAVLLKPDFTKAEPTYWPSHIAWWKDFWSRSSIAIPDERLERQYYLDMYKFGCVARGNTPPISLQAIWTADNGNLPPWKGDFHHDLNTQLSYWPGYASNHLDLTAGYTNWMLKVRKENERWTRQYFELPGLNVPGVSTISGKEMGGWIQYSMSPTTSAWLAQHFYWQAMYSKNRKDYEQALSWLNDVELFLYRYLEKEELDPGFIALSSSPEYHDNSVKAWFRYTSNYDKALIKFVRFARQQLIEEFNKFFPPVILAEDDYIEKLGAFDSNETGLTVAPGQNLDRSHRHLSPYMAIYPLCLLDVDKADDKLLINQSLRHMEKLGTREWCGYSFSWMACMYARCREADSAVSMLNKFASNFVSSNSFHLNGDQKGGQYSNFTYRPFTLEGNFAYAQGVQELLLQTRERVIEVFPAVPDNWKNVSFRTLRVEGAFLVSATRASGVAESVSIKSETGGNCVIRLPFKTWIVTGIERAKLKMKDGIVLIPMIKGQVVRFKNGYE